jgi:hypothetical protein
MDRVIQNEIIEGRNGGIVSEMLIIGVDLADKDSKDETAVCRYILDEDGNIVSIEQVKPLKLTDLLK